VANMNEVNWTVRRQTRDVVRSEVALGATLQSEPGRSERLRIGCCKENRYDTRQTQLNDERNSFFFAFVRTLSAKSNPSVCYAFASVFLPAQCMYSQSAVLRCYPNGRRARPKLTWITLAWLDCISTSFCSTFCHRNPTCFCPHPGVLEVPDMLCTLFSSSLGLRSPHSLHAHPYVASSDADRAISATRCSIVPPRVQEG